MEIRTFVIGWIGAFVGALLISLARDSGDAQSEAVMRSLPRALGLATVIAAGLTFGMMTR
jgi:uncharacterized membrane protein YeaQ/YmgE (transglycosylase-associated protein family)